MPRTPRAWENLPGDNTGRNLTLGWFELAYAAVIALVAQGRSHSHIVVAQLTGALTINISTPNLALAKDLDEFTFYFTADGTARTVTWGTNFVGFATTVVAINKGAVVKGVYDAARGVIRLYVNAVEP